MAFCMECSLREGLVGWRHVGVLAPLGSSCQLLLMLTKVAARRWQLKHQRGMARVRGAGQARWRGRGGLGELTSCLGSDTDHINSFSVNFMVEGSDGLGSCSGDRHGVFRKSVGYFSLKLAPPEPPQHPSWSLDGNNKINLIYLLVAPLCWRMALLPSCDKGLGGAGM